ncbi:TPA: hypothetical protein DDY55_00755 [Candidatus Falkowbacteria bacterium]|nr:hypothetical protein [Candidatus Falkowbacteria bacterium]HAY12816.1 hypothetical protein [Candidatus Falkowbacteria bacterium]HBI96637.1 hypothetical protein [Candidatus Falkowbacteria bacterium]HBT27244.1 hypothetical protein [Candidatus Falkowbacteria bacterium]HBY15046.1 hypothetical protein [Candidatus Falkowbacteria bacterium]
MKLYHGSKNSNLNAIKKMQAKAGEGIEVPEDELKNGIYLTPHYDYALAMAIRPNGITYIDDKTKTIEFENPELFMPEEEVCIYEIEVPENEVRKIDNNQFIIEGLDEIKTTAQYSCQAKEIKKYYNLKNWTEEQKQEIYSEFKIK